MSATVDLLITDADLVTATDRMRTDIAVRDGRVVALGEGLDRNAARTIPAGGRLVTPGGVDAHCHIEQRASTGVMTADDFLSGTISAAHGGTTTVLPFAAQHRGQSLREVVRAYHAVAEPKAVIDYGFHLIVSDPTETVLGQELPALIEDGYTSFKVYMTYDALRLNDRQMLDVFATARREGALVMVHAENHDMIGWLADRLLTQGHRAPKFHTVAHSRLAEGEATRRAIDLARLADASVFIVHVSEPGAMAAIRQAQTDGANVFAETCPQYLFLTAEDTDKPGMDGAMWCCSPPPRDEAAQEAMWRGLANGTFAVFSSDHAPYTLDAEGKLAKGPDVAFKHMVNGVPGLEVRMPLLLSEGVGGGRIDLNRFVAVTATEPAKVYGLFPRKGTVAVGSDADLVIWDREREVTLRWEDLHDRVGYTPYEGRRIRGWPDLVISRGRVVIENGALNADPGTGRFLPRVRPDSARPGGRPAAGLSPSEAFGADLF